jgi:hypothetical protein
VKINEKFFEAKQNSNFALRFGFNFAEI